MNSIKSATRSAWVAFAPEAPFLASGTLAGGVDLLEKLEIFKLDFQSNEQDLPVVGECISKKGFNRLSWGNAGAGTEEYAFGLIAGRMSDGIINVWNPAKMMRSSMMNSPMCQCGAGSCPLRTSHTTTNLNVNIGVSQIGKRAKMVVVTLGGSVMPRLHKKIGRKRGQRLHQ